MFDCWVLGDCLMRIDLNVCEGYAKYAVPVMLQHVILFICYYYTIVKDFYTIGC
eukprot:gene3304-2286_t